MEHLSKQSNAFFDNKSYKSKNNITPQINDKNEVIDIEDEE